MWIKQQVIANKYQLGIYFFNKGIENYNYYVAYTNNPDRIFKSQSDIARMRELLNASGDALYKAESIFQNLISSDSQQQNNILTSRIKIAEMVSTYENTKSKLDAFGQNRNNRRMGFY